MPSLLDQAPVLFPSTRIRFRSSTRCSACTLPQVLRQVLLIGTFSAFLDIVDGLDQMRFLCLELFG